MPYCGKRVRGWRSLFCEGHRQRKKRHGDPEQQTITKKELKPYAERVERIIERDRSGKIREGLEQITANIRNYAQGVVSDFSHGRPMSSFHLNACREILNVFQGADAVECASVVAGMWLLLDKRQSRFASARGFFFELARRFRALSKSGVVLYQNSGHQVRKDLSPRTTQQLWIILNQGYKPFVECVRQFEQQEAGREEKAKMLLQEGFNAIARENINKRG